ncbi:MULTISPECIES: hypothetical protein [Pontibacillus]|uniref:Major capsid protein n=1 Tax=Pontibacillus chungwhensis TaxID=265426 RepID=A0ABY8V524_9BACI|nr:MULTISPECIES: hypothetical protein [Pontibacillus]MCD5326139.1 hypothetical protein [Pontibacillus sp. HN14]WIG00303.1 hypothetical protein QNI29_21085 [Pontibacillus chungwhensis]
MFAKTADERLGEAIGKITAKKSEVGRLGTLTVPTEKGKSLIEHAIFRHDILHNGRQYLTSSNEKDIDRIDFRGKRVLTGFRGQDGKVKEEDYTDFNTHTNKIRGSRFKAEVMVTDDEIDSLGTEEDLVAFLEQKLYEKVLEEVESASVYSVQGEYVSGKPNMGLIDGYLNFVPKGNILYGKDSADTKVAADVDLSTEEGVFNAIAKLVKTIEAPYRRKNKKSYAIYLPNEYKEMYEDYIIETKDSLLADKYLTGEMDETTYKGYKLIDVESLYDAPNDEKAILFSLKSNFAHLFQINNITLETQREFNRGWKIGTNFTFGVNFEDENAVSCILPDTQAPNAPAE